MDKDSLRKDLIKNPKEAKYYLDLGFRYHSNANYKEAIRCYRKGLEVGGKESDILCKLGLSYHNLGDHKKAIDNYKLAIESDRTNFEAVYYAGFIEIQEGNFKESIKYLELLINQENTGNAYYQYGIAMEKLGKGSEALKKTINYIVKNEEKPEFEALISYGYLRSGIRKNSEKKDRDHLDYLVEKSMENMGVVELHCFGDSHRSLLNNIEGIYCHNVGSATAYNLGKEGSTTNAGAKISNIIKSLKPNKAGIVLVFGEIDCMEHIGKNILRSGLTPEKIIKDVCTRYCQYLGKIRDLGYKIIVIGVNISGYAKNSHGNIIERGRICKEVNKEIKKRLYDQKDIYYADISHVTKQEDGSTDLRLTEDGRHLDYFPKGSRIMQAIVMSEIIKAQEKKRLPACQEKPDKDIRTDNNYICIVTYNGENNELRRRELRQESNGKVNIKGQLKNINYVTILIDLMDHHRADSLTIYGEGLEKKIDIIDYREIKKDGNESKKFSIHRQRGGIVIKPMSDIARIIGLRVRITEQSKNEGKEIKIDNINVKRKEIWNTNVK